jgi:hypothetical protein
VKVATICIPGEIGPRKWRGKPEPWRGFFWNFQRDAGKWAKVLTFRSAPEFQAVRSAFSIKLSLTAAALGCTTRKQLCERFRAVNPRTDVDVERCYKWLQGVALPRNAAIYDDWGKVVGLDRPAGWFAACTPEAFAEELCAHLSANRAELEARAARFAGARVAGTAPQGAGLGPFLVYSWAMSPRHEGRLIRGLMTLGPARARRLSARYEEGLAEGPLVFSGAATEAGRTLSIDLEPDDNPGSARFFMVLATPGRPLDALCGEIIGAPISATLAEPTASRVVALRIAPEFAAAAIAPGCYLQAHPGALAADLDRLGLGPGAPRLSIAILDILSAVRPALGRTGAAELSSLTAALGSPVSAAS